MGRLIFRAFQCEMELEYIIVSRLLLVPEAKGLWRHYELVSVNLYELVLAAVLRSAALFTVYDFETSYVSGSWLSAGLTIAPCFPENKTGLILIFTPKLTLGLIFGGCFILIYQKVKLQSKN